MSPLRRLARRYPHVAAALVLTALLMRLLIPGGYMLSALPTGAVGITLCSGMTPAAAPAMTMAMPAGMAPMDHGGDRHHDDAPGKDVPCAFAGIGAASLAGADIVLLVAAIAFAMQRARTGSVPPLPAPARRLRPPLRGPPAGR